MPVPDEPVEPEEPVESCDEEECPYTNSIGFRGRVCDPSCADGIPFGTNGCGTRDGRHGPNCRLCYNDDARARSNDDPNDRAIMYVKYCASVAYSICLTCHFLCYCCMLYAWSGSSAVSLFHFGLMASGKLYFISASELIICVLCG